VRAIARHLAVEPDYARTLAHAYFALALVANTLAALIGFTLADPIARVVFGKPEVASYIRLALMGLVTVAGSGFAMALLQATRRFGELAALQVLTALTYLAGIVALVVSGNLSVLTVVLLGALNPMVGFMLGLKTLGRGWISLRAMFAASARRARDELITFGKWVWVSTLFSLLAAQMDLLLLGGWVPAPQLGIYALAFNLSMRLNLISEIRFTILMPKASALRTRKEIREYAQRNLAWSLIVSVLLALGLPFAAPFIVTFYGNEYAGSISLLVVLVAAVVVDLVNAPLALLAFPFNTPKMLAVADVVRVIALIVVAAALIPTLGAMGAALAKLSAKAIGAMFTFAALWRIWSRDAGNNSYESELHANVIGPTSP
jgi:O-antigen/teichoic acid export membrane protein